MGFTRRYVRVYCQFLKFHLLRSIKCSFYQSIYTVVDASYLLINLRRFSVLFIKHIEKYVVVKFTFAYTVSSRSWIYKLQTFD